METKIVDLLQHTVISKSEYDIFFEEMETQYGHRAQDFKFFFNNIEHENPNILEFTIQDNVFYPTSLHKDIQLTSAQVRKKIFKDTFLNTEYLIITIEYVGKDPYMKGFYREYIYSRTSDNEWNFYGFNGTGNYLGEGYSPTYLDLK